MTYCVPRGGLPPQTALTTDRARSSPRRTPCSRAARMTRHRRQPYLPALGRHPAVGAGPAAVRLRRDLQPVRRRGRARRRHRPTPRATRTPRRCCSWSTGALALTVDGSEHALEPGGYAFLPPGTHWTLRNTGPTATATFHWIRKAYERVDGLDVPDAVRDPRARRRRRADARHRRRLGAPSGSSTRATCATTCTSTSSASSPAARSRSRRRT